MRALLSVAFLFSIFCGCLYAQDDSERVFAQIHEYLSGDIKIRAFSPPLLFVGEITALGPVFDGVCKDAVSQTVDFAVTELLLGDLSENAFHYGYPNCTRKPLPSPPFALYAPVILYCHHHHLCFQPVPETPERLKAIRAWVAEARRPEDAAALEELRKTIRKASPLQAGRDLVFEGEIVSIEPAGTHPTCTIAIPREIEINAVKVLFGEAPAGSIHASYGSTNCPIPLPLSVRLHARAIVYCATQKNMLQVCLKPVEDSPRRLAQMSAWIAGANSPPPHQ